MTSTMGQNIFLKMEPAVDAALGAGYRLFDTAKFYYNEAELGLALEVHYHEEKGWWDSAALAIVTFPCNIYYIDLVLIHFPKTKESEANDPNNAKHRRNTYKALETNGLIRSIGVSNYEIHHLEEIREFGQDLPAVIQVEFHPHFTRDELRNYCIVNKIFFQAYASLARHNEELMEHEIVLNLAKKYSSSVP
ncbi:unnamed protein product, partial [Strongylus vulgaris]